MGHAAVRSCHHTKDAGRGMTTQQEGGGYHHLLDRRRLGLAPGRLGRRARRLRALAHRLAADARLMRAMGGRGRRWEEVNGGVQAVGTEVNGEGKEVRRRMWTEGLLSAWALQLEGRASECRSERVDTARVRQRVVGVGHNHLDLRRGDRLRVGVELGDLRGARALWQREVELGARPRPLGHTQQHLDGRGEGGTST